MKFYIAGRTKAVPEIRRMTKILVDLGHEVSHDWTQLDCDMARPYPAAKACQIAQDDLSGVKNADVFIIVSDEAGTGMYVELGVALAQGATVYALGEYNDITVFHYLPTVKRFKTFEDVLNDLK